MLIFPKAVVLTSTDVDTSVSLEKGEAESTLGNEQHCHMEEDADRIPAVFPR